MSAPLDELCAVEAELDTRWPETVIDPSLRRIAALVDLLGAPHRAYPVLHVAGTNGKTSTARMIDALLTRIGLRVGRYTSPHLQRATERISIDGLPVGPQPYVDSYRDIAPYVSLVDGGGDVAMSKFEVLTGMAFAAFADAPVEAAVLEVGLGGRWDATNVADAQVAVVTPIGVDHVAYLGSEVAAIAAEKAGIIKPGSVAVLAEQPPEIARVLAERCIEVDATVAREGMEFAVLSRDIAVGGQQLRLQGLGGVYDEVFLPLHGAHQARNAVLALAAVETFFGAGADRRLDIDSVREAFAGVTAPGRLERVRSAPREEFTFRRVVLVVAAMRDKDVRGILSELEPVADEVVVTAMSSPRAMALDDLAAAARGVFGEDRLRVEARLDDAIEAAVAAAEDVESGDEPLSGGGVVITGSVVVVGDSRTLFGRDPA